MADTRNKDCPCKRVKCVRLGDCEACRAHHQNLKYLVACDRIAVKKEKQKEKQKERQKKTKSQTQPEKEA